MKRLLQPTNPEFNCRFDAIARLSGQQFALLLEGFADGATLQLFLHQVCSALAAPCSTQGREVFVEARIGVATSPFPVNGRSADTILLEAMARNRLQLEAEQQELLTQLKSVQEVARANPTQHFLKEATTDGRDPVDQQEVMLNARMTALAAQVEQYNQRPRKYFDAPGAAQSRYAAYLDQWRSRIETTGTEHYPRGAGPLVYGTLRASVTVRADGTVIDVTIDQPSNEPLLNLAVKRIVSLAAPFAPFPPDIARQVDQIVITRTWHFVNGALQTRQP